MQASSTTTAATTLTFPLSPSKHILGGARETYKAYKARPEAYSRHMSRRATRRAAECQKRPSWRRHTKAQPLAAPHTH
eukprot:scaffold24925_cov66-Phaeocystis_antarctica.AAC.3